MICILHGYLLEGSGSNLWTRLIVEALCRRGETIHLMCQENHPERYPFVHEQRRYHTDGHIDVQHFDHSFDTSLPGRCILHKPILGDTIPVFVWDRYEEFPNAVPMVEMEDGSIEAYLQWNADVLTRIIRDNHITAVHANHGVLMAQVAERAKAVTAVPFAIMPHGSELEYAIRRDRRFRDMAAQSLAAVTTVFVHGEEMRGRVRAAFPEIENIEDRFVDLHLGVDTDQFRPVPRLQRADRIALMCEGLAGRARGRTAAQTRALVNALDALVVRENAEEMAVPIEMMAGGTATATRTRPRITRRPEHSDNSVDDLMNALDAARDYDAKAPDADIESRLGLVDWDSDTTLLYVGRLISTKGVQSVLAAFPLLLQQNPELKLIVVGHGPLREPLEALMWAMERGDLSLIRTIAEQGRTLERSPQGDSGGTALTQMVAFLDALERAGRIEDYRRACTLVRPESVIFTGYLTHRELHHLFACCDAAVFPSVVREAGPLVFLEALASGAFPLGTYFGGMRASIDAAAQVLPPSAVEIMKLSADPAQTVADIVRNVPRAIAMGDLYTATLFNFAREHYDWTSVAEEFRSQLEAM